MLVTWTDASADLNRWSDPPEMDDEPRVVTTCGFLAMTGEHHLHIAQSHDPDSGSIDSTLKIPHDMVVKITYLVGMRWPSRRPRLRK